MQNTFSGFLQICLLSVRMQDFGKEKKWNNKTAVDSRVLQEVLYNSVTDVKQKQNQKSEVTQYFF